MREFVEYIVKILVTMPEAVVVEESSQDGIQTLILTVASEDMGLIIGKGGQTIKSIRKLLAVKAMTDEVRVDLRLNDLGRVESSSQSPDFAKASPGKPESNGETVDSGQDTEEEVRELKEETKEEEQVNEAEEANQKAA